MSRRHGFGRFIGGLAIGAGLGLFLSEEGNRKMLANKVSDLYKKIKETDFDEVRDELLMKVETLQGELASLDSEKAKDLALEKAKDIKEKAEEIYKVAIEKSAPTLEKAANEVRKQALVLVKNLEKKLED